MQVCLGAGLSGTSGMNELLYKCGLLSSRTIGQMVTKPSARIMLPGVPLVDESHRPKSMWEGTISGICI